MNETALYEFNQFPINSEFWRNKKVVVTGHTGFKGSWLTYWLERLGAKVLGIALEPNTQPNLFEVLQLDKQTESKFVDIRNYAALKDSINGFGPEILFHLAAQPIVLDSYRDPIGTLDTNVMGTVNLLQCCREIDSLKSIVVVSTDKCYENHGWLHGYRETDRLGGLDPYSASKACVEIVVNSFRNSFGLNMDGLDLRSILATARAGNVFGGGDWARHRLIPDAARACAKETKMIIRNPNSIRPWQHVLEPLSGYMMLARALVEKGCDYARAWNFGPSDEQLYSVQDVIEAYSNSVKNQLEWEIEVTDQILGHEAATLLLDSRLARSQLGWKPFIDFKDAMKHTAEWYEAFYNKASSSILREYCSNTISLYSEGKTE